MSEMIKVVDDMDAGEQVSFWGNRIGELPFTYLGLSFGASFNVKMWDNVVGWFERRLESFNANICPREVGNTLIKSVLSSIPSYSMSLFTARR